MITKLISYFCDVDGGTYYSDHGKRLKKNCEDLGINHDIVEVESYNDYRLNTLRKPKFILEKMHEYKSPVLWMDVDSYIHRPLQFFDFFNDKQYDMVYSTEAPDWGPMKASPIYLPYKAKTIKMVERWIEGCQKVLDEGKTLFDHEVLLWDVLPLFIDHPHWNWEQKDPMKLFALSSQFCTWPHRFNKETTYITMGLSDVESKGKHLKDMGYESEESRSFQMVGKTDSLEDIYFEPSDIVGSEFPGDFPKGKVMIIRVSSEQLQEQTAEVRNNTKERLD